MNMADSTTGERPAAVLLLVYQRDGEWTTLLTERSKHVSGHRGEISLPGGRPEPGDRSLFATALREAQEEIGIDPLAVTLLGALAPVSTYVTNYSITPFVAHLTRPVFIPNEHEVAALIELPLVHLVTPGTLREEIWERNGLSRTVYFYDYSQRVIWGATARILHQFAHSPLWPITAVTASQPDE